MLPRIAFPVFLLLVHTAFTQPSDAQLRSKINNVRYPPLAEQARIQGDVHLKLNSGVATWLSGHPLLSRVAVDNIKSWESILEKADADVTYHFLLADTVTTSVPKPVTVKRGTAFERAILRMFGRPTEKVVLEDVCQTGVPPANDLKVSVATIEIWVYGRTLCMEPAGAQLVRAIRANPPGPRAGGSPESVK